MAKTKAASTKSTGLYFRAKAQMEIMGLAIIIILVALSLLFAVQWMTKAQPVKAQRAQQAVMTENFLNTLLGVTTQCNERTIRDLLQDCALTGGARKCGEENSCSYAQHEIKKILDLTVKKWNLQYHLVVKGSPSVENFQFDTRPCSGAREQKTHPIPISSGFEIIVVFEICE